MALLVSTPTLVAFTRNPIRFELQTQRIPPSVQATITLDLIDPAGANEDDYFTISYNGTVRTLTFKNVPTTANHLPTKGTLNYETWWANIAEWFRQDYQFSNDFIIEIPTDAGTPRIRLRYRTVGILAITAVMSNSLTNVAVTAYSVTAISTVENLSAWLGVYDAETNAELARKTGQYNYLTRRCEFNINEAFSSLKASLPSHIFIEKHTNASKKYYIRYADQFGFPATTEPRVGSSAFWALHGGTSSGNSSPFFDRELLILHNAKSTPKLVTKVQPDWLYICNRIGDYDNLTIDVLLYLDDDTTQTHSPNANTLDIKQGEVWSIGTGFKQLGLHLTPQNAHILAYDVRLIYEGISIHTHKYALDPQYRHPYNFYILYDNGLGGMETIRLKGKKVLKYNTEQTAYETDNGQLGITLLDGTESIEVSTGYYDLETIKNIRQLLLTKTYWLTINTAATDTYNFQEIIIETKNADIAIDDTDIDFHALTLSFKKAYSEKQHNSY